MVGSSPVSAVGTIYFLHVTKVHSLFFLHEVQVNISLKFA